jgi:hypothetical protein
MDIMLIVLSMSLIFYLLSLVPKSKWSSSFFFIFFLHLLMSYLHVDSLLLMDRLLSKQKSATRLIWLEFSRKNSCRYYTLTVCCQWLLLIFYRDNTLMLPKNESIVHCHRRVFPTHYFEITIVPTYRNKERVGCGNWWVTTVHNEYFLR